MKTRTNKIKRLLHANLFSRSDMATARHARLRSRVCMQHTHTHIYICICDRAVVLGGVPTILCAMWVASSCRPYTLSLSTVAELGTLPPKSTEGRDLRSAERPEMANYPRSLSMCNMCVRMSSSRHCSCSDLAAHRFRA